MKCLFANGWQNNGPVRPIFFHRSYDGSRRTLHEKLFLPHRLNEVTHGDIFSYAVHWTSVQSTDQSLFFKHG